MTPSPRRVVHLVEAFSPFDRIGRTVAETVTRIPAEHHLITTSARGCDLVFDSVHEVGSGRALFPMRDRARLHSAILEIDPDVVHFHTDALGPVTAQLAGLGAFPLVLTMYEWASLPTRAALATEGVRSVRGGRPSARQLVSASLPTSLVHRSLHSLRPRGILSPDIRVLERLEGSYLPLKFLPTGAPVEHRRATREPGQDQPRTVVFTGPAASATGVRTLVAAFPAVLARVPDARLLLLLQPGPDLARITEDVRTSTASGAMSIDVDHVPDVLGRMASAQVGCWPFLTDFAATPPASPVLDAMTIGLPVVATPVGSVRSVLNHEVNGITVSPGDPDGLASAIALLLLDGDEWHRIVLAADETVGGMTWDATARVTASMYAPPSLDRWAPFFDAPRPGAGYGRGTTRMVYARQAHLEEQRAAAAS